MVAAAGRRRKKSRRRFSEDSDEGDEGWTTSQRAADSVSYPQRDERRVQGRRPRAGVDGGKADDASTRIRRRLTKDTIKGSCRLSLLSSAGQQMSRRAAGQETDGHNPVAVGGRG